MTDMGRNGVSLGAMGVSVGLVIAGGEAPEWKRGVSRPVGFQRRIAVGAGVNGLVKVMIDPRGT